MAMTRRQFGTGIAASLGVLILPRLRLQPQYDLHAMLRTWCADMPYSKYDLTAPYGMSGHAYATDARAMARIVDEYCLIDGETKIPRETVEVWDSFWTDDGHWQPWPRIPMELNGDGECWRCLREWNECPTCDGEGDVFQEGYRGGFFRRQCPTCRGDGYVRSHGCPVCHGRRDIALPTVAVMGEQLIGCQYMDIVRRVPDVYWRPGKDSESPILWRSDVGIAGMIMPRDKP